MRYSNDRITEELGVLRRRMMRTVKAFEIEKEEHLVSGGIEDLLSLRELTRTTFTPDLQLIFREVQQLKSLVRRDSPGMEVAEETALELINDLRHELARLVSVPNRLVRACRAGTLERLRELDAMDGPLRPGE